MAVAAAFSEEDRSAEKKKFSSGDSRKLRIVQADGNGMAGSVELQRGGMGWIGAIFGTQGSDEDAMARVRTHGDATAFGRLMQRWEGPIGRLCVRMVGNADLGAHLAQETFVRVFARREQYAEGKRFSTWLWQIALNVCREELRHARRRGEVPLGDAEPAHEPGPVEWAEARERAALVRAAVLALPEALREVVILREYEELRFRAIAEILGVPEGTVKWRMAQGLSALARRLKCVGDDKGDSKSTRVNTHELATGAQRKEIADEPG